MVKLAHKSFTAEVPVMEPFNATGTNIEDRASMDIEEKMQIMQEAEDEAYQPRGKSMMTHIEENALEKERSAIDGHRADSNPKSALGVKKPPIHLVSPISILHEAMAMAEGGMKYGPYNYRADHVAATVYIAAAMRHILAWSMGEDLTKDSKLHHLAHAKACCGILLDAEANGSMIDDRFKSPAYAELVEQMEALLPEMAERIEAMKSQLEAHNR